jgi:ADP-heptose:LPS heptosyltransferase
MSDAARTRLHHGYRFKRRALVTLLRVFDGVLKLLPHRSVPIPEAPRSILVMKPDHLGDLVMVTAVLPLLADRYPGVAIDVLCGPWGGAVLENNPAIRWLLPLEHILYDRRPVSAVRKLLDFFRSLGHTVKQLRAERYDLCLNLRDAGGDLIFLARLGGCRHVIGHSSGGLGPVLDTAVPWTEGVHEVEHYLEVLRPLGIEASPAGLRYRLHPQPADREKVSLLLERHRIGRFVVIHPGSGDLRKLRPASFWAGVVDSVDDCRVVMTGSKDEERLCADICGHTDRELLCLAGELTVVQLYLLLQKAEALYALDSLAAHLGGAAGVPTTVYWSETNDPEQWRPLGETVTVKD